MMLFCGKKDAGNGPEFEFYQYFLSNLLYITSLI